MAHMKRFLKVYEEIQQYLLDHAEARHELDPNRRRYLKQMMDTTCLGGKYYRGLCVVDVTEAMIKDKQRVNHETPIDVDRALHDACVCGWMIEMLQAHFLVEDDIMDKSLVRRGKPCWYLHPGVTAQVAINDGLIVLAWATQLCMHYFSDKKYLLGILRVFHEVDLTTTMGQLYDVTAMVDSKKLDANVAHAHTTDYVEYTLFNYTRIVKHKTAYYTYYLPLIMGLLVSESMHLVDCAEVEHVALLMGEYFQVQDDVMDCFTLPEKLGKVGTDIQDAKCSWLAVTFLASAPADKVADFKANYGQDIPEKIQRVKTLFTEAKLLEKFANYEEGVAREVDALIAKAGKKSPAFASSLQTLWDKTYKRQK